LVYNVLTDTLGSSFVFLADYTRNISRDNIDFNSSYNSGSDSVYRSRAPYHTSILSFQADFKKVLSRNSDLKFGVKSATVSRNNQLLTENLQSNVWLNDSSTSNTFLYDETISAFYSSYSRSSKKSSFALGVRGELTRSKGRSLTSKQDVSASYFNIFPSFSFQSEFNKAKRHTFYLSLNSRITRPDFNDLNPYRFKIDNFTYQLGNPALKPQYSYTADASVSLFQDYNAGVYFSFIDAVFANLLSCRQGNVIEYQVQNFDRSQEVGFYMSLPLKLTKWWTSRTDLTVYNLSYRLQRFNNSNVTAFVRSSQMFNINKVFNADLLLEYRSPYVYSNAAVANRFNSEFGLSAKMLGGRARFRLIATDLFNTVRDKTLTYFDNTSIYFFQKRPTRTVGFSFSYSVYKGLKFSPKNVQQIGNEEKSRLDK
jgi:hypothetical protein